MWSKFSSVLLKKKKNNKYLTLSGTFHAYEIKIQFHETLNHRQLLLGNK